MLGRGRRRAAAPLEDARDALLITDHLVEVLTMATEVLRASQAARRLGLPTKEVLRLALERKIRYVMVRGMVHFPKDALEEYRTNAGE